MSRLWHLESEPPMPSLCAKDGNIQSTLSADTEVHSSRMHIHKRIFKKNISISPKDTTTSGRTAAAVSLFQESPASLGECDDSGPIFNRHPLGAAMFTVVRENGEAHESAGGKVAMLSWQFVHS